MRFSLLLHIIIPVTLLIKYFFMKNILMTSTAVLLAAQAQVVSAIDVDKTKTATKGDNITDGNLVGTLDLILGYFIGLLYFIAVLFALYGGFMILTAGGDEEKVKKGKTTLIQAVIGLAVIFLASQIISWVISVFTSGGSAVSGS